MAKESDLKTQAKIHVVGATISISMGLNMIIALVSKSSRVSLKEIGIIGFGGVVSAYLAILHLKKAKWSIFNIRPKRDGKTSRTPPKLATILICIFLSGAERENILGDLAERFPKWVKRDGLRMARIMCLRDACTTVYPAASKAFAKIAATLTKIAAKAGVATLLAKVASKVGLAAGASEIIRKILLP